VKNKFAETKDPESVALFYVLMGKTHMLAALYMLDKYTANSRKVGEFLMKSLDEDKNL